LRASRAIDAMTSASLTASPRSRPTPSAPNPGATGWKASMKPVQKRTGSASAGSHDSHAVVPGARAAAQLDSRTLFPVPAVPVTMVRRWPAPAVSRSCSADLMTNVTGNTCGRNFVDANRMPGVTPSCMTGPSPAPPIQILPIFRAWPLLTSGMSRSDRSRRDPTCHEHRPPSSGGRCRQNVETVWSSDGDAALGPPPPGNRSRQPPVGRETGFWFARTSRASRKGLKAAGQADGTGVILNEDDTDPAAGQAAIYMNTQANGDPARRDAGPISYV
jgi:hypothetical protein